MTPEQYSAAQDRVLQYQKLENKLRSIEARLERTEKFDKEKDGDNGILITNGDILFVKRVHSVWEPDGMEFTDIGLATEMLESMKIGLMEEIEEIKTEMEEL